MRILITSLALFLMSIVGTGSKHLTAESKAGARISAVENWSCAFGGKELTLHFRVENNKPAEGRLLWHYSANQRTLARGESEIKPNDDSTAEVVLRVPEVRDGVIYRTNLAVAFVQPDGNIENATLSKTLWLFPEDPFTDQREALKERQLSLFDPEGRTAELFEKISLPHQQIQNVASLADHTRHSYVIVGEGTSLIRHRGLAEQLLSFAATGGTVLMLAPSEGIIPMPERADADRPGELRFRRHHVIRDFDKRLDSISWPGISGLPGSKISLRTRLGQIGMELSDDGDWSWLTIEYPETNGRFVFCGFSLVEHWDSGPTPRYLLARILIPETKNDVPASRFDED